MAEDPLESKLEKLLKKKVTGIKTLTSLWEDYGSIKLATLENDQQIIVKEILPPQVEEKHENHTAKMASYKMEETFYKHFANDYKLCKVPEYFGSFEAEADCPERSSIVIEGLVPCGFKLSLENQTWLSFTQLQPCLKWLAQFHANHLNFSQPKSKDPRLWPHGTYWHLRSRKPCFERLPEGDLKKYASAISEKFYNCEYQTVIHGDAKLANFMVAEDYSVAAGIDFQWTGYGCGVLDVYYLLTSCFDVDNTEKYCPLGPGGRNQVLDFYFQQLETALKELGKFDASHFQRLQTEWASLWIFAVADLERFIRGWKPNYFKLTRYTEKAVLLAIESLKFGESEST